MIALLRGLVLDVSPPVVAIDTSTDGRGIAYEVITPSCDVIDVNNKVSLWVHTHVSESAPATLYGFLDKETRSVFRDLIALPMLGPKLATAILRHLGVDGLFTAIEDGNAPGIEAVPGVGRKLATRIVSEMRVRNRGPVARATSPRDDAMKSDVSTVLNGMGFTQKEIKSMMSSVGTEVDCSDVEGMVRACLRVAPKDNQPGMRG